MRGRGWEVRGWGWWEGAGAWAGGWGAAGRWGPKGGEAGTVQRQAMGGGAGGMLVEYRADAEGADEATFAAPRAVTLHAAPPAPQPTFTPPAFSRPPKPPKPPTRTLRMLLQSRPMMDSISSMTRSGSAPGAARAGRHKSGEAAGVRAHVGQQARSTGVGVRVACAGRGAPPAAHQAGRSCSGSG